MIKNLTLLTKAIIVYILIGVIFIIAFRYSNYSNNDYNCYKRYNNYESTVLKKMDTINKDTDKHSLDYYNNLSPKDHYITHLKEANSELMALYNSFEWNSGDEVTKELFHIQKQILLNYANMYNDMRISIESGIRYSNTDTSLYIQNLKLEYYNKDKLQREKFGLPFEKQPNLIVQPTVVTN